MEMNFWADYTLALGLFFLTVMSPGPDFLIVTKMGLNRGFRTGAATALGIGCGLLIHSLYCLLGVAFVIKNTPALFLTMKLLGGIYLFYLGVKSLKSRGLIAESSPDDDKGFLSQGGLLTGFLTNILNVKVMLWFLVFFTVVIPDYFTFGQRLFFVVSGITGAVGFFVVLAMTVSRPAVIVLMRKTGPWLDRLIGLAFLFFAIEVFVDLFK